MTKNQNKLTSRMVSGIMVAVLVLTMFAVLIPHPAAAAPSAQTQCAKKHEVRAGETLSSIGLQYDVTWLEIAIANNLKDPYTIYPGQILCIPGASSTPDDDDEPATPGKGPSFDVSFEDDYFIRVVTNNYSRNKSQIVKVSADSGRWKYFVFEIIGRFSTDKNGSSNAYIRLPREYRDVPLWVCLKNPFTDSIQCDWFSPLID